MKYNSNYKRPGDKIENFQISAKISESLKRIVKYFHVFYHNGENIFFVTIDDKVFGMGKNNCGVLALGHVFEVKEPKIIPELCEKSVKKFHIGKNLCLAMTNDNNLLVLGSNRTHICINFADKPFHPVQIGYFNDKMIEQICCVDNYNAVLTSDGKVHLLNIYLEKYSSNPLDIEKPIKSICCSNKGIFCLTQSGNVFYCWNYDKKSTNQIETITNVNFVAVFSEKIFFITRDLKIYFFNECYFEEQPEEIHHEF